MSQDNDVYLGRKWDPKFMAFLPKHIILVPKHIILDQATGKLTFNNIYANVVLNFGWKGGVIPIPYSHVVWFLTHGKWPVPGNHIHHLNDDPIDNRPVNLHEESEAENHARRRGRLVSRHYGTGKYGYGLCVHHDKRDGRYYITRHLSRGHGNGDLKAVRKSLGGFDTLEEAEVQVEKFIGLINVHGLAWMPASATSGLKKRTIELTELTPRIRQWREEGKTLAEIKKLTGFSEGTLSNHLKDIAIDKRTNKVAGAKLTVDRVHEIKRILRDDKSQTLAAIARKYGVTAAMISDIAYGRAWKHVK